MSRPYTKDVFMVAQNVPQNQVPAIAREGSGHYQPRLLAPAIRPGDRITMLAEASRAIRRAIANNDQELHPMALHVLIELATRHNMQEGVSWPDQQTIANNLGADPAAISRAISELVKYGFVVRVKRGKRTAFALSGPIFEDHLEIKKSGRQVAPQDNLDTSQLFPRTTVEDSTIVPQDNYKNAPQSKPYIEPGKREPGETTDPTVSTKPSGPESTPAKRNKVKELMDRCIELGVEKPSLRGQDIKALGTSMADPRLVAEAWEAAWTQRWKDDWVQKNMTIQVILSKIDVYKLWLERGSATKRQGPSNGGPSAEDAKGSGFHDGYLDPKFRGIGVFSGDHEHQRQKYFEAYGVYPEDDKQELWREATKNHPQRGHW